MKRSLLGAAALALASGCSGFRSMFPSHEQVYTPVASTIGEARVVGSDTSYVVTAPGYELAAPTRDVLPQVKSALDLAAGRYRRYFGDDPPPVLIELRPAAHAAKDARPESTWVRSDGARGVTLTPLQPMPRRRYDAGDLPIFLSVQPVAHLWLSALADRTVGRPDSAARALAARTRADPRIPDWIEDALIEMIAPSSRQDFYSMQLARQPGDLMPLRALFEAARPPRSGGGRGDTAGTQRTEMPPGPPAEPPVGPPTGPPDRGGGGDRARRGMGPGRAAMQLGPSARFAAQSLAVAQWMAEQEGAPFIGQLAVRLIAGERAAAALAGASTLPADLDRLDAEWRAWLARQNADEGFRRPGGGGGGR